MEKTLFVETFLKANNIKNDQNIDIFDDAHFSFIDILKEKKVKIKAFQSVDCLCVAPNNLNIYYDTCDKCQGEGVITYSSNIMTCNKCHGQKRIVKHQCNICHNKGSYLQKKEIEVNLNKQLRNNDVVELKGLGQRLNNSSGNLYLKVIIDDFDHYSIKDNDLYLKKIINYNAQEFEKKVSKQVETIKGIRKIKPENNDEYEIIKLEQEGLEIEGKKGDFYLALKKELSPIKGFDLYKNTILKDNGFSFYVKNEELYGNSPYLEPFYFKPLNDENYTFISLDNPKSYQTIKIKGLGQKGYYHGENGDLYLRVFIGDKFFNRDNVLYDLNQKFSYNELNNGKKILLLNNEKVTINYNKNPQEIVMINAGDHGFIVNEKQSLPLIIRLNPFEYEVYQVTITNFKKDSIVYLDNYQYYFFEEVKAYLNKTNLEKPLKINLKTNKNKIKDKQGNLIIFNLSSRRGD